MLTRSKTRRVMDLPLEGALESYNKRRRIEEQPSQNTNDFLDLSHESTQVENLTSEVEGSMKSKLNINSLPPEILLKIFKYLTHNELGSISRVCKSWKECAKITELWENVDVNFFRKRGSQQKIAANFAKNLSPSVTHMKIEFKDCDWQRKLNFERFCIKLHDRCSNLHTLTFYHAFFNVSVPSVVNFCSEFLPNLKILIIYGSTFVEDRDEGEFGGLTEIETLEISLSLNVDETCMFVFLLMPYLKKLYLTGTEIKNSWFLNENVLYFLRYIEVLHLGSTDIPGGAFRKLQKHCTNLTELFLCWNYFIEDEDFNFMLLSRDPVFPVLKTICLNECGYLTCEGVVSLLQACPTLQNVYVDRHVARSFAKHPFAIANASKLAVVKGVECDQCYRYYHARGFLIE